MKSKVTLYHEDDVESKMPLSLVFNWNEEVRVFDKTTNKPLSIKFSHISLIDHLLIVDGTRFYIANMFSKEGL